ncbi:MAG: hypothetical protein FK733_09530 [Asgard group archaeon]|nr:hypothetical protein [Asgard group archaeon]
MVNLQTENIRCILCNKHLDVMAPSVKELTICGECQAYFCPTCLTAIRNYDLCPAASLLGVGDHELRFVKLLPPKQAPHTSRVVHQNETSKTIKIIDKKKVKILDKKDKLED